MINLDDDKFYAVTPISKSSVLQSTLRELLKGKAAVSSGAEIEAGETPEAPVAPMSNKAKMILGSVFASVLILAGAGYWYVNKKPNAPTWNYVDTDVHSRVADQNAQGRAELAASAVAVAPAPAVVVPVIPAAPVDLSHNALTEAAAAKGIAVPAPRSARPVVRAPVAKPEPAKPENKPKSGAAQNIKNLLGD